MLVCSWLCCCRSCKRFLCASWRIVVFVWAFMKHNSHIVILLLPPLVLKSLEVHMISDPGVCSGLNRLGTRWLPANGSVCGYANAFAGLDMHCQWTKLA
jgi:hypothetical protein